VSERTPEERELLAELEANERELQERRWRWVQEIQEAEAGRRELLLRARALGVPAKDVAEALSAGARPEDVEPGYLSIRYTPQEVGRMMSKAERYTNEVLAHNLRLLLDGSHDDERE
jgi:hypothetical protein